MPKRVLPVVSSSNGAARTQQSHVQEVYEPLQCSNHTPQHPRSTPTRIRAARYRIKSRGDKDQITHINRANNFAISKDQDSRQHDNKLEKWYQYKIRTTYSDSKRQTQASEFRRQRICVFSPLDLSVANHRISFFGLKRNSRV